MYQAAVYDKLQTLQSRQWYLTRAFKTIVAMSYQASWYSHQGLMDGTNFWSILLALEDEGMNEEAAVVREIMSNRTLTGVHNQCRYYACQPGDLSVECEVAKNSTNGIGTHPALGSCPTCRGWAGGREGAKRVQANRADRL